MRSICTHIQTRVLLRASASVSVSRHTSRYMIATHAEVQRKVADELDALGLLATTANPHPRQLEYEDVSKLVYLNNCIKASLCWLVTQASLHTHITSQAGRRAAPLSTPHKAMQGFLCVCCRMHGTADRLPHILWTGICFKQANRGEPVVQESLRMRPPVSGTMRTPVHDLRLGPYTLPAGTLINVNLGVMGNSALNYVSPELYLPARPSSHPLISGSPIGWQQGGYRMCQCPCKLL